MSNTNNIFFNHLKNDIYCRLAPSNIHGIGVFAIKDIPINTDPFSMPFQKKEDFLLINKKYISELSQELQSLIKSFYSLKNNQFEFNILGPNNISISWYLNHSEKPNLISENGSFKTIKPIYKGEELLVKYHLN
jgi:SET domain-containing protein